MAGMAITAWSDDIALVNLGREPQLSEDFSTLLHSLDGPGATPRHVVLDLHDVHMLTSSNLAALMRLRKLQKLSKKRLVICRIPDRVWAVFLTAGLDEILETCADVGTALASIQIGIG